MFADGKYAEDAKQAGADIVGLDDLISDIKQGKIDFDVAITAPRYMPKLAPVARVRSFRFSSPPDSRTEKAHAF